MIRADQVLAVDCALIYMLSGEMILLLLTKQLVIYYVRRKYSKQRSSTYKNTYLRVQYIDKYFVQTLIVHFASEIKYDCYYSLDIKNG